MLAFQRESSFGDITYNAETVSTGPTFQE